MQTPGDFFQTLIKSVAQSALTDVTLQFWLNKSYIPSEQAERAKTLQESYLWKEMNEYKEFLTSAGRNDQAKVIEEALKSLLEDMDFSHSRWINQAFGDIQKRLPYLYPILSNQEILGVGALNWPEVNAQAILAPNGGWLIVLHQGLHVFLYEVARALATRFIPENEREYHSKCVSFEEMSNKLKRHFSSYVNIGYPDIVDLHLTLTQLEVAIQLTKYAIQFVLCHELAHVMLGHLENSRLKGVRISNVYVETPTASWQQELEADSLGLTLLVNSDYSIYPDYEEYLGNNKQMAYSGAEFFLLTASFLEKFSNLSGSKTHPPSATRLKYIREKMMSHCVDDATREAFILIPNFIEMIFNEALKINVI